MTPFNAAKSFALAQGIAESVDRLLAMPGLTPEQEIMLNDMGLMVSDFGRALAAEMRGVKFVKTMAELEAIAMEITPQARGMVQ